MATKKKSAKKSRKTAAAKAKPAKKSPLKAKTPKKAAGKKGQNIPVPKTKRAAGKAVPRKRPGRSTQPSSRDLVGPDSAGQSGDLQGLSNVEGADSESVDELIEEGNAFEAGIVSGVEEAGNRGVREVHTREVLEDDVPGEYLDEE